MLDANPIVAHHLIASRIQGIYRMIMKHPQNGSSKGISTLLLAAGPQGKLMTTEFGQRWRSSIYQLFLFLCTAWKSFKLTSRRPNPTRNCWNCRSEAIMNRRNRRADDKGEIGLVQLRWSRKRSRAEFHYYLKLRRKLIPGIPTGFFWAMGNSAAFE